MIDADIMGLGRFETIDYVKSRLNLDFLKVLTRNLDLRS
jgi:hypothetical protein